MPEPANDSRKNSRNNGKILLPFENGEIAWVTNSLYAAPKGQHRPIDAYVVTECEGVFTESARRAAETVFNLVGRQINSVGPLVAGFDAQGARPGLTPATGESGGLAFSLALAGQLLNQSPDSLAATGVVKSSAGEGLIGLVNGIEKKIAAAIKHLPEKARILYPAGNHPEISESLAKKAEQKQQMLCPVASVAEAIGLVYPECLPPRRFSAARRTGKQPAVRILLLTLAIVTVLAVMIAMGVNSVSRHTDSLEEAESAAEIHTQAPEDAPALLEKDSEGLDATEDEQTDKGFD